MARLATIRSSTPRTTARQVVDHARDAIDPLRPSMLPALDHSIAPSLAQHPSIAPLPRRGQTIEVQGQPGSAKTALLLFQTMTTLVPASITIHRTVTAATSLKRRLSTDTVDLGGRGPRKNVLFLNLDEGSAEGESSNEALAQLAKMLHDHLDACLQQQQRKSTKTMPKGITPAMRNAIVARWLSRLRVWSPPSPWDTLEHDTERVLRQALLHLDQIADGAEIALIVVDSLTPLYLAARAKYERQMGTWPASPSQHKPHSATSDTVVDELTPAPPLQGVLTALRALQRRTRACLLLANGVDPELDRDALVAGARKYGPPHFYAQLQSWPYPSPFRMQGASPYPNPTSDFGTRHKDELSVDWHITLVLDDDDEATSPAVPMDLDWDDDAPQKDAVRVVLAHLREGRHGYLATVALKMDGETGALLVL